MKLIIFLLLFLYNLTFAQTPNIIWQKCYGGSNREEAYSVIETKEGSFVVAGFSNSEDGDVKGKHNVTDYWIIKINKNGDIQWQKCLGGSDFEEAKCIRETKDGGYIVAGFSESSDGDVSGNHNSNDAWIIKLNKNGDIQWQKCYGGSYEDKAYSIIETKDGNFIFTGYETSIDGDIKNNHGNYDCWVVKLNAQGNILWQKCLGGSDDDWGTSVIESDDGNYVVSGNTVSNNGDVKGLHSDFYDAWVVKLNQNGDIQWQKCLGGSLYDEANSISKTKDGGFIVAGLTESNDGDVKGNHGKSDYWVVKLNQNGDIQWQKCLGGSDEDKAYSVIETKDNNYIVAGITSSNDGDVTGYYGEYDIWIVKLDKKGELVWQKCLGGTSNDKAYSIIESKDGNYVVAGFSNSSNGDVRGLHGQGLSDFWIIKLSANK